MDIAEITGQWDYTALPPNVRIGSGCYLERKASFDRFRSRQDPGLVIGDNVRVHNWTEFNVEPSGWVEIGEGSVLVGAIFMCADHIRIGQRVILSYQVTIADSDFHPRDPESRKTDAIANAPFGDRSQRPKVTSKPVIIEDDVWVGIGAIILKGVHIGKGSRVGPGAIVTSDVSDGTFVAGNPARAVPSSEAVWFHG